MPVKKLKVVYRAPGDLIDYENNTRVHSQEQEDYVRSLIREFGFTSPILLKDDDKTIGAGHLRRKCAVAEGIESVPTITLHGLTDAQWRAYVIADNRAAELGATWDVGKLELELAALGDLGFDTALTGFSLGDLENLRLDVSGLPDGNSGNTPTSSGALRERFGVPPFSVLNAREGWWQDRKRAWIALGIKSELGRGEGLNQADETTANIDHYREKEGTRSPKKNGGGASPTPKRRAGRVADAARSREGG